MAGTDGIDLTNAAGVTKFLSSVNTNGQLDINKAAEQLSQTQGLFSLAQEAGVNSDDLAAMLQSTLESVNVGEATLDVEELDKAINVVKAGLEALKTSSQSNIRPNMGLVGVNHHEEIDADNALGGKNNPIPESDAEVGEISPGQSQALMETLRALAKNYSETGTYTYNPKEDTTEITSNADIHIARICKKDNYKTGFQNPGAIGTNPDGSLYQKRDSDTVSLYLVYEMNGKYYKTESVEVPVYKPNTIETPIEVVDEGDNFQ